jgi:hypothetical protein
MIKQQLLEFIDEMKAAGAGEAVRQALVNEALRFTALDFIDQMNTMAQAPTGTYWDNDIDGTYTTAGQAVADAYNSNDAEITQKTIEELVSFLETKIVEDQGWFEVLVGVQLEID